MPYWITKTQTVGINDNFGLGGASAGYQQGGEFYELEPAIVLDVILDKDHPFFKQPSNLQSNIDVERWPADYKGSKAVEKEIDYSWIGRTLVRLQYSSPTTQKEKLVWAYPLESSVTEYPLVNEVVVIMKYGNKYFYTRRVNIRNLPNESVDFSLNPTISGTTNNEIYTKQPFVGPVSKNNSDGSSGYRGVSGKYFQINNRIRRIQKYEGDTCVESRFGQSIRLGTYDDNRNNDSGHPKNTEYTNGGGNPSITIRNRQRQLLNKGEALKLANSPNPATVIGTSEEKNAGGYIKEDINHDGSTIQITSGQTISKWVTTCYKKLNGTGEEVSKWNGKSYKIPVLNGDQIVINSDRLVLSSRYLETFHYSKKRYSIVTDADYTLDAHQQIVLTTNTKTVINSPAIYLGEHDNTEEPALLGQTTVNWLYDLCTWLLSHTHWYLHSHVDAGKESPSFTQAPKEVQQLIKLRDRLEKLLSRRVFITGGGFAPGENGGSIVDGTPPVAINVSSGGGVPGGWKGANKR
jgi:hypothetical protein